jgi:hypothetical protein
MDHHVDRSQRLDPITIWVSGVTCGSTAYSGLGVLGVALMSVAEGKWKLRALSLYFGTGQSVQGIDVKVVRVLILYAKHP